MAVAVNTPPVAVEGRERARDVIRPYWCADWCPARACSADRRIYSPGASKESGQGGLSGLAAGGAALTDSVLHDGLVMRFRAKLEAYLTGATAGKVVSIATGARTGAREAISG